MESQSPGSSIWTIAQVEVDRKTVADAVNAVGATPEAQIEHCLERMFDERVGSLSIRFMFALKTLELHARTGLLSAANFNRVVEIGKSLLRLGSIRPIKSKVSFLYRELHEAISLVYAREGMTWEALWEYQVAQLLARKGHSVGKGGALLETAVSCWRLAQGMLTEKLIERAREEGLGEDEEFAASLLETRVLLHGQRWTDLTAAVTRLSGLPVPEAQRTELKWRQIVSEVVRSPRNLELLVRTVVGGALEHSPGHLLQAWLWVRIFVSRDLPDRLPALKTIRGRFSEEDRKDPALAALWRSVQSLDQAYDPERPLDQRLRLVQRAVSEARRALDVEHEVLVVAAAVRWLVQFNQMELAAAVLMQYQMLSYGVSGSASLDVLNAFGDLRIDALLRRYASKPAA